MKKTNKKPTNLEVISHSLMVGMMLGIAIGVTSGAIGANRYNEFKYMDCICPIDNKYQPTTPTASELPQVPHVPDIEEIRF